MLLLGEIDLSAGLPAGVCAVSMAWLLDDGFSPWIAHRPPASSSALAIGALTGLLVAKVGIPSFVVTLAFFLSWQGVVLHDRQRGRHDRGQQRLRSSRSPTRTSRRRLGWVLWAIVVVGYLA